MTDEPNPPELSNLDEWDRLSKGGQPTPEPAAPDDSTTQARYVGPVVFFPAGGRLVALPAKPPPLDRPLRKLIRRPDEGLTCSST